MLSTANLKLMEPVMNIVGTEIKPSTSTDSTRSTANLIQKLVWPITERTLASTIGGANSFLSWLLGLVANSIPTSSGKGEENICTPS